jgi:hypothetical protein
VSYRDLPMYITAADLRAANDRRNGVVAAAPPPPSASEIKRQLALRVAEASKGFRTVRKPPRRRAPGRVLVASGLRSDCVSLTLQSPAERRRDILVARMEAATGPTSLVASALANARPVNDRMAFGLAYSADGDRVVSIMVPR